MPTNYIGAKMKKFLCIVLLFVGMTLWAQKKVTELDGTDWVTWTLSEKTTYVEGFVAADVMAIYYLVIKEMPLNATEEEKKIYSDRIVDHFGFKAMSTTEVVNKINEAYLLEEQRTYPLCQCILAIYGKDFWTITPLGPAS
jgi:hypothetical protein